MRKAVVLGFACEIRAIEELIDGVKIIANIVRREILESSPSPICAFWPLFAKQDFRARKGGFSSSKAGDRAGRRGVPAATSRFLTTQSKTQEENSRSTMEIVGDETT